MKVLDNLKSKELNPYPSIDSIRAYRNQLSPLISSPLVKDRLLEVESTLFERQGFGRLIENFNANQFSSLSISRVPCQDLVVSRRMEDTDPSPPPSPSLLHSFPSIPLSSLSDQEVEERIQILSQKCSRERVSRLRAVLTRRSQNVRFAFENPANPHNIEAALRTFDAFGVQFIDILSYSPSPSPSEPSSDVYSAPQPQSQSQSLVSKPRKKLKGLDASHGSRKWVTVTQYHLQPSPIPDPPLDPSFPSHHDHTPPLVPMQDMRAYVRARKAQGYRIFASDLHEGALSLLDMDWASEQRKEKGEHEGKEGSPILIIMGNEEKGISQLVREEAEGRFFIPQRGLVESLNLSAACAVLCAVLDSRGALPPSLPLKTQSRLLLSWLQDQCGEPNTS